uniref:Sema domain-containing protein n=1 Tax=Plectus sambesii TaxID=2011161 RepID=A0A914VEW2_9BILA
MKRGRLKKNDEKKKQGDIASKMEYLLPPNTSTPSKSLNRRTSVVLFTVLSTLITPHAQELTSFTEKVDFEMPLLKMSLMGDRLAAVSLDKIHLLQMAQSGLKEIQSGSVPKTGKDLKAPSDFKLLDNNRVQICYPDGCFIGDISETPAWKYYPFPSDLSPAVAVSAVYTAAGVLNAYVISGTNSAILRYGEDGKVIARADDMNAATDLTTSLSFERDVYTYFLGSAKRDYEPDTIASNEASRKLAVRLTRVCNADRTFELQSRIDLALTCGEDEGNLEESIVLAAIYDAENDRIVLLAQNVAANSESKEVKICSFQLADLERTFDDTWNVCQNTSHLTSSLCKYRKKGIDDDSSMPYCFIMARCGGSNHRYTPCSAYNNHPLSEPKLSNCDLAKLNTTSYACLEQFKPFVGVVLARLARVGGRKAVSLALSTHSVAFVQYNDGSLIRVLLDEKANTSTVSEPLWNISLPRAHRQSIAVASNRLVYLNDTIVQSIQITCASLYQTCEMVVNKSDRELLGCGWCGLSDNSGYSISKVDNRAGGCVNKGSGEAGVFLVSACPPHINQIVQKSVNSEHIVWEITGTRLDTMTFLSVKVCGQECIVTTEAKERIICVTSKRKGMSSNCMVTLKGRLFDQEFFMKKSLRISIPTMQQENSSSVWAVFVVIGFLVVTCLIVPCFFRRRFSNRPTDASKPQHVRCSSIENGRGGSTNSFAETKLSTPDNSMATGKDQLNEQKPFLNANKKRGTNQSTGGSTGSDDGEHCVGNGSSVRHRKSAKLLKKARRRAGKRPKTI